MDNILFENDWYHGYCLCISLKFVVHAPKKSAIMVDTNQHGIYIVCDCDKKGIGLCASFVHRD